MYAQTPMLDAAKFEDLVYRRGRAVKWQEAAICSCWNTDSGQPSYSCKACHGKGFVYQSPKLGKVALTSVTLNNDWQEMAGIFEVGDAVMTVPNRVYEYLGNGQRTQNFTLNPLFEVGVNDRISLTDDEFKTSEVLIHGVPIGGREPDTLLNDEVTRLKYVRAYDSVTGEMVEYALGTHFTLDSNKINWLNVAGIPQIGEQYSVTYFHRPMYTVVATLPKPRHQDGQDFPRYVALRYLAGGVDVK